jgi:hypothetical protein
VRSHFWGWLVAAFGRAGETRAVDQVGKHRIARSHMKLSVSPQMLRSYYFAIRPAVIVHRGKPFAVNI